MLFLPQRALLAQDAKDLSRPCGAIVQPLALGTNRRGRDARRPPLFTGDDWRLGQRR